MRYFLTAPSISITDRAFEGHFLALFSVTIVFVLNSARKKVTASDFYAETLDFWRKNLCKTKTHTRESPIHCGIVSFPRSEKSCNLSIRLV